MKTNKPEATRRGPLYSMLARSEEKKWGYFETGLYALVMVAAVVAIMQFNLQPDPLPLTSLPIQSRLPNQSEDESRLGYVCIAKGASDKS